MARGGRTRPTHTHKFVGVAILTASRGGVQLSPHRQPRARATSHRTALSLGQRQVRLGREKPVDHRSRAHAQPPTPPSLRTWEPVLSHANKAREDAEKAAHKARVIASVKCCVCEHAYTEEAYEERLSRCAVRGCPGAYMSEDVELLEFRDWFA